MQSTRRDFLRAVPILAAIGGTLPATAGETANRPSGFSQPGQIKLGLVTYNLAKDWDVATIIKNCTEAKFDGTELRTSHAHKVEVDLSAAQRAEVKRRFADSPVQLMGLGSAFDYHTPDPAKLRSDLEATKEYIVLAHDVGATGVKVRPNGFPKEVPPEKTLAQIGRSLREAGEFAQGLGQVIRLEVHGPGTSLVPHIQTIMEVADHPAVGVCWNSNQSDLEGDGFDPNFDRLKSKIFSVHLRDLYLEEYPFHRLFRRLVESGFHGYTMAEIPESADGVRVMKYFRGLWQAYQGLL